METCTEASFRCPAWRYAAIRYELYRAGRSIELLACYDPAFRFMAEWWKQLFGESEGKEGKGLARQEVQPVAVRLVRRDCQLSVGCLLYTSTIK